MLSVEVLDPSQTDKAAAILHRDGFVCVKGLLTPEQLEFAQAGAARVIREQTAPDPERLGNRGHHRYSFGDQQHNPEWVMLIDLPGVVPILDKIWGGEDWYCIAAGGDYSLPGAEIQPLHSDMGEFFNDPYGAVTFHDPPPPFIVVNYMMVDFTKENGAIRFIPATQRSRSAPPGVEHEPEWMKDSILCAPAGTAVIRDVRCWHGGTHNGSGVVRPMISAGYFAPWFRLAGYKSTPLSRGFYDGLSPRGKKMCDTALKPG